MTMRAVVLRGGRLAIEPRAVRPPGPGEIRIAVHASGLNRADVLQRRGRYPAPPGAPPDVPGLEYAGIVEAIGEGVQDWSIGDRAMGIVGGGGLATHVVVHAREAIPVPASLSLEEAAAIPEVFLTSWDALVLQAGIGAGQRVLVHAVGSGIGTAAIQIVRASGAIAIGTSRSPEKLARCATLGMEKGIEVGQPPSFADRAGACDVILDTVGAAYASENLRALAERGTIVTLGLLGGATAEISLSLLLAKRARWIGSVLRARPLEEKAALARAFAKHALPLFERGALSPVIGEVMPIERIEDALSAMEANATFGKIVLRW